MTRIIVVCLLAALFNLAGLSSSQPIESTKVQALAEEPTQLESSGPILVIDLAEQTPRVISGDYANAATLVVKGIPQSNLLVLLDSLGNVHATGLPRSIDVGSGMEPAYEFWQGAPTHAGIWSIVSDGGLQWNLNITSDQFQSTAASTSICENWPQFTAYSALDQTRAEGSYYRPFSNGEGRITGFVADRQGWIERSDGVEVLRHEDAWVLGADLYGVTDGMGTQFEYAQALTSIGGGEVVTTGCDGEYYRALFYNRWPEVGIVRGNWRAAGAQITWQSRDGASPQSPPNYIPQAVEWIANLASLHPKTFWVPGVANIVCDLACPTSNSPVIENYGLPHGTGTKDYSYFVYDDFEAHSYGQKMEVQFSSGQCSWENVHAAARTRIDLYAMVPNHQTRQLVQSYEGWWDRDVPGYFCPTASSTSSSSSPPPPPPPPAPSNDDWASAYAIGALPWSDQRSTSGATMQWGEQQPCAGIAKTVWYRFSTPPTVLQATHLGRIRVDTQGSSYDTVLAVYAGSPTGTRVACNDDSWGLQSLVEFDAMPGTEYWIQAGGFYGASGYLVVNVQSGLV